MTYTQGFIGENRKSEIISFQGPTRYKDVTNRAVHSSLA